VAWSFVGSTDLGNVHSGARSVTAGNLLLAIYINGLHTDVPTLSDGVNTWTKIGITFDDASNDNTATWWWAPASTTASITPVVANITGADEGMAILEWHSSLGAVPANSLGPESRFQQTGPPTTTDAVTSNSVSAPSSDGALLLSWVSNYNSGANTETAGTGFTDRFTGTAGNIIRLEEFIQSTAAAKAGTWTVSVSTNYVTFAAFFTEAAGGAGQPAARRIAQETPGLAVGSVRRM